MEILKGIERSQFLGRFYPPYKNPCSSACWRTRMKIGVDFGTTYTKIAYLDEEGKPTLFTYPKGSKEKQYIPTAVSYSKRSARKKFNIGNTARLDMTKTRHFTFCDNFKMLLPLEEKSQCRQKLLPKNSPEPSVVVC